MKQGGWLTRSAFDRYGIGDEEELAEMYEVVDARIARETDRLQKSPSLPDEAVASPLAKRQPAGVRYGFGVTKEER